MKVDSTGEEIWSHTYGGFSVDEIFKILKTEDNRIFLIGSSGTNENGDCNVWLVQIDEDGEVLNQRQYGSEGTEFGNGGISTTDGGFLLYGTARYGNFGTTSFFAVKTDSSWEEVWSQTFDITELADFCKGAIELNDGGFMLTGIINRQAGINNTEDFFLLRISGDGDSLWSRTYGGDDNDVCHSLIQTVDGGFVMAGHTQSFDLRTDDYYVLRTDSEGEELWSALYGTGRTDYCYSIIQTLDGGYMLAGQSNVNGLEDGYLVKTGMDMLLWLSLPDTGFVENDSLVYALDYFRSYTSPRVGIDSLLQFTVRDVEHVHGEIEDGWLTITADPDWFGSDSLLLTVTEVANEDNNASTYLRTTVREYEDVTEPLLSNSPKQFKLLNPYPNPFNSSTTIQYQLPESSQVDMQIVDIQGRRIVDLVKGRINAGYHTAVWDGSNAPSGIYYCWIKTDDNSQCVKLVLLR